MLVRKLVQIVDGRYWSSNGPTASGVHHGNPYSYEYKIGEVTTSHLKNGYLFAYPNSIKLHSFVNGFVFKSPYVLFRPPMFAQLECEVVGETKILPWLTGDVNKYQDYWNALENNTLHTFGEDVFILPMDAFSNVLVVQGLKPIRVHEVRRVDN